MAKEVVFDVSDVAAKRAMITWAKAFVDPEGAYRDTQKMRRSKDPGLAEIVDLSAGQLSNRPFYMGSDVSYLMSRFELDRTRPNFRVTEQHVAHYKEDLTRYFERQKALSNEPQDVFEEAEQVVIGSQISIHDFEGIGPNLKRIFGAGEQRFPSLNDKVLFLLGVNVMMDPIVAVLNGRNPRWIGPSEE